MVSAMSDQIRHPPPSPDPAGDDRREQIAERTRHLRGLGLAGAVAALGVFTGLAATHGGGTTSGQPGAAQAASPVTRATDDQVDPFGQNDFFGGQGGGGAVLSGGGGARSLSSGGS